MSEKIVLIDGNSLIYRAFFALPLLHNEQGIYTNAVYGFTTILMKILEEEKPTHMLVAFDAGKTTFRHETYEAYKAGRAKTPPELREQFPLTKELLKVFQIPYYELDLYEADDIIGTVSKWAEEKNWEVKVISGDQDLLQLVSERVTVDVTKRGITEVESYTPTYMKEKMELSPSQIIDLKALMGDSSDNIPGVPGVGIKTATKLLKEYETLENIYEHLDDISGKKLKENLITYKEDAFLSKELVTINRSSPIEIKVESLNYPGYDAKKLYEFFHEMGFRSLLDRIEQDDASTETKSLEFVSVEEVSEDLFTGNDAIYLEMLDENYHQADIEGIGLVNAKGNYFIPTSTALQSEVFKKWAENEVMKKTVFDAKGTKIALLNKGISLKGMDFDLLLAAYVINPAEKNEDIPSIAKRFNGFNIRYDEEVYGKGTKRKIPPLEQFANHVVQKAYCIYKLREKFEHELKEYEQYDLYKTLEFPLALILAEMEQTGVQIDQERLKEMKAELDERLQMIEDEIYSLAGETFNLNSPKQLGGILFEKLGLPVIKKTKTGYSTAVDVLEKLESHHPIISNILLYRQLNKLQSTYVEGLLKVVAPETKKIHTRFNQALTQTGRLSSVDPNLQNIPIRLEEGRKIRQAFIPSEDNSVIFAADYSQIELRVLAHIAQDEKLIESFQQDLDIHTRTAKDIFHVAEEEVTREMRDQAKAVNFGIVYGMSDYGLSQNLGITRKEAKHFIDRYFMSYPGVKRYMDDIIQQAKEHGYVTTIMNRRRYLPDINSRNFNRRSFAERTAMNTPIQGSAADIIKKAMVDLHAALLDGNLKSRLLLQVHDELILEVPMDELDVIKQLVPKVMEETVQLSVPLKVDYTYGKNWFETN